MAGVMDAIQAYMQDRQRQPGIKQPPGAYGAPQYAPNVGAGAGGPAPAGPPPGYMGSRPAAPAQESQGMMAMIQNMMAAKKKQEMMAQLSGGGLPPGGQLGGVPGQGGPGGVPGPQQDPAQNAIIQYIMKLMAEAQGVPGQDSPGGAPSPLGSAAVRPPMAGASTIDTVRGGGRARSDAAIRAAGG